MIMKSVRILLLLHMEYRFSKKNEQICHPDNFEFMNLVVFEVLVVLTLNIRAYNRLG
jgi:hypothetical protein